MAIFGWIWIGDAISCLEMISVTSVKLASDGSKVPAPPRSAPLALNRGSNPAFRVQWQPCVRAMTDVTDVTVEAEPERSVEVPGNEVDSSATTIGPSTMATVEERWGDWMTEVTGVCVNCI